MLLFFFLKRVLTGSARTCVRPFYAYSLIVVTSVYAIYAYTKCCDFLNYAEFVKTSILVNGRSAPCSKTKACDLNRPR
jgi:hypothetical protein